MPGLTRDDLPADIWKHRYQVGFLFGYIGQRPIIYWRTVPQDKFLAKLYRNITQNSYPLDVLAMFHAGMVQGFGRTYFRALRA